jgi:hypothetical protein
MTLAPAKGSIVPLPRRRVKEREIPLTATLVQPRMLRTKP